MFLILLGMGFSAQASAYDFSYSGRLVDDSGKPFDGPLALKVSFFHSSTTTSPVLEITAGLSNVSLQEGVFQITMALDPQDFQTIFPSVVQAVYVQITDVTHGKSYDRQQVSMLPYAGKIPVDSGIFEFNNNGEMTFAAPPETGKYLKGNADGSVSWDSPAGGVAATSTDTFTNKTIDADVNTITDIADANIKASAAIADSKLATISTAGKVSGAAITSGTIAGTTAVSTSGDIATTGKIGIGAAAGTSKLEVTGGGATSATSALNVMNSTPTSLLYVRNDGNVGIGTTAPSEKLQIGNPSLTNDSGTTKLRLVNGASSIGSWNHLVAGNIDNNDPYFAIETRKNSGTVSEDLRIIEGNVGIGTTSPGAKLEVNTSDANGNAIFRGRSNSYVGQIDYIKFGYGPSSTNFAYIGDGSGTLSFGSVANRSLLNVWYTQSGNSDRVTIGQAGPQNAAYGALGIFAPGVSGNAVGLTVSNGYHATSFKVLDDGQTTISAQQATTKPLILKGAASHTANLQEWQNSAGTALSVVNASGNVGIGTTSPEGKLAISSGSNEAALKLRNTTGNTGEKTGIDFYHYTYSPIKAFVTDELLVNWGTKLNFGTSSNSGTATAATTRMTIDDSGNVGIGTTSPNYSLHLHSASTAYNWLQITGSTTGTGTTDGFFFGVSDATTAQIWGKSGMKIQMYPGGTASTTFLANGNVGIGTTSPQAKLHVEGGAICVSAGAGSNDCSSAANTAGTIFAVNTTVQGADYAEYFAAEDALTPGDIVGISHHSGLVRRYQAGDKLVGVASTEPGVIGNSKIKNKKSALVALMGQVPFDRQATRTHGNIVKTADGVQIGYMLASGDLYLQMSSIDKKVGDLKSEKDREIAQLKAEKASENAQLKAEKDRGIAQLKAEKDLEVSQLKADNDAMRTVLCEMRPEAAFCAE
jgi:hypothetical protein